MGSVLSAAIRPGDMERGSEEPLSFSIPREGYFVSATGIRMP
jgi:hypothetical protein